MSESFNSGASHARENPSLEHKSRSLSGQSAEWVVTLALLGVCATAGISSWLGSAPESAAAKGVIARPAPLQTDDARESAVLMDWQQRIERDFNRREQSERQQAQSQELKEQAQALALARAAAEAAERAAAEAESRARRAEQARKLAGQPAPTTAPGKSPAAVAAAEPVLTPANIDWSTCDTPAYPTVSIRRGEEGNVTMAFDISPDGSASNGRVVESSGSRRLDSRALDAVGRCRFAPATQDGVAIDGEAQVRFAWKLQ